MVPYSTSTAGESDIIYTTATSDTSGTAYYIVGGRIAVYPHCRRWCSSTMECTDCTRYPYRKAEIRIFRPYEEKYKLYEEYKEKWNRIEKEQRQKEICKKLNRILLPDKQKLYVYCRQNDALSFRSRRKVYNIYIENRRLSMSEKRSERRRHECKRTSN